MKQDYEVIDDRARGDLGGVKVVQRGKQRIVTMTAAQAKWFVEHGTIKPVAAARPAPPPPADDRAVPRRAAQPAGRRS